MRRVLESITAKVNGFVAQRDDLAMVVRARPEVSAAFLQVLSPVAESSAAGLFFTHDHEFTDPAGYVEAVAKHFTLFHDGARAALIEAGMKPWPPVPKVFAEPGLPPVLWLQELMIFSRSLLPHPDVQVVVWTFMPKAVASPGKYAAFVKELLAHEWPVPWCHHMRVMVRDDPADDALKKALGDAKRVQWYEPPLGPEAYQKGYEEAAADPSLPVPERMQALLIAATTDCSHGRHAVAREKLNLVIWYYVSRREALPAAIALNSLGECHVKTGNPAAAGPAFEQAMAFATDTNPPSVAIMFNVAWNLGHLRMSEKRFPDAIDYFAIAQQSAVVMRAADLKLIAMEQGGVARLAAGKRNEAVQLWEAGATVADKLGLQTYRDSALNRLREFHKDSPAKVREIDRRLAASVSGPPPEPEPKPGA